MRDNPLWPPVEKRPCPKAGCAVETSAHKHYGHCMNCGEHIGARTSRAWSMLVKQSCPRCGRNW